MTACSLFDYIIKKKNLVAVFGGMAALMGMFLPYVEGISFFQSLSGPRYGFFAPYLTLLIACATVLYALGLGWLPQGISVAVLVICLSFPGYACWASGPVVVLPRLRAGAWVLLAGASLMALSPFFRIACGKTSKI